MFFFPYSIVFVPLVFVLIRNLSLFSPPLVGGCGRGLRRCRHNVQGVVPVGVPHAQVEGVVLVSCPAGTRTVRATALVDYPVRLLLDLYQTTLRGD